ncbi:hypothetical protein CTA1_1902 [Colletotrichum tanaceti]|uniref:Uncharacterized protein n=1 Tax=Colletotrichum tanaceti TaxID=1306861 RepID=A0A4U6XJ74_9PEZI|nr:hypothetical protein CTA1_1902 [Colletotrichum tanaceti]
MPAVANEYMAPHKLGHNEVVTGLAFEIQLECDLARVRRCFDTITMASDALSNFKDVRIVPLEAPITAFNGPLQDLDHWSIEIEKVISPLVSDSMTRQPSPSWARWTKAKLEASLSKVKVRVSK